MIVALYAEMLGSNAMATGEETASRTRPESRVTRFARTRLPKTFTVNLEKLQVALLLSAAIGFVALCAYFYAYFIAPLDTFGRPELPLGLLRTDYVWFMTILGGAAILWVRSLIKSVTARWLSSMTVAAICLIERHLVEGSIFFATALLILTLRDLNGHSK
jgi:vacuolar-type H+-ATPase subunit I/STV1